MKSVPVALVTGGSRGIGAAICRALAGIGYAVVVNYRSNEAAANTVVEAIEQAGGRAVAVQADVSSPEDRLKLLQETLRRLGDVHLLVNNAGVAPPRRVDLLEIEEQEYRELLEIDLHGPFFLSRLVARHMLKHQDDETFRAIINISSVSAEMASVNRAAYCIAKAGMSMMSRLFAVRLADHGIRVYEIRPGIIATDMTARVRQQYDRLLADGLAPMRRWGQPEEVAQAVAAIARGDFAYSTGLVIYVDGGMHVQRL